MKAEEKPRLSSSVLELEHVCRSYRRADGTVVEAVADVSLTIAEGEFVCVIGPSGGGKTTLLQLIAGLTQPTGGKLFMNGEPITKPGWERGVVFQQDSVFPWMRVIRNVEYGLRVRGVDKQARREIAQRYLKAVGLDGIEHSWPRELSGGMLKRVAVATVFANGAEVLLLDEPFGPLDYVTRRQLHDVLLNLWAREDGERRRTVLFVTHDVDEALTLGDRIIVIRNGVLAQDLDVRSVPRPRTTEVLALPEVLDYKHLLLALLGLERDGDRQEVQVGRK